MSLSEIFKSMSLRVHMTIVGGRRVTLKPIVNTGGSASREDNSENIALPSIDGPTEKKTM